jgi:hypothetical protein
MFESGQPTPQEDVALYRQDGRFFELIERESALLLRLRPSALLERRIMAAAVFSLIFLLGLAQCNYSLRHVAFSLLEPPWYQLVFFVALCCGGFWMKLLLTDATWEFQKYAGQLHCRRNQEVSVTLEQIHRLRGWRRGLKYYLSLEFNQNKSVQLGTLGFSMKERAWRDDAEQIAAFLEVSLEMDSA